MFAEYNKKQTDKARQIDFEDESIRAVRCEFERTQIYEHIDDQIKAEHVFTAWLSSNDSFAKEYKVAAIVLFSLGDVSKQGRAESHGDRSARIEQAEEAREGRKMEQEEED